MTLLYYITIICLNLTLIYVITFQHVYGRKMKDTHFQFRRHSFLTFFSILVSATISDLFIVDNGRIEILPLFTICLYYSAFVTFVLLASAYYGRMHYRNPFNWFFLLQYPLILIIFYFIMRLSHRYRQIYQWEGIIPVDGTAEHVIFVARVAWLGIILLSYLFMLGELIEAYIYWRKHRREHVSELESEQTGREHFNLASYVTILILLTIAHILPYLWFHSLCHILLIGLLLRSIRVYTQFVRYTKMKYNGCYTAEIIRTELLRLLKRENNNPIYSSNCTLEAVADILNVDRMELSDYIYNNVGLTFSAWISEKKLCRCADLLAKTDREISDIAMATGYRTKQAMYKAFKARFKMTPAEYRKNKNLRS